MFFRMHFAAEREVIRVYLAFFCLLVKCGALLTNFYERIDSALITTVTFLSWKYCNVEHYRHQLSLSLSAPITFARCEIFNFFIHAIES